MKAYIECTGCEQRQMDADKIERYLKINSIEISNTLEEADYIIVFTCAVDNNSINRSQSSLFTCIDRKKATAKIILAGCLMDIEDETMNNKIQFRIPPKNMNKFDTVFFDKINKRISTIPDSNITKYDNNGAFLDFSNNPRKEFDAAKRGYKIKINEGCLLKCSYCNIKKATGNLKSKPIDIIKEEFKFALKNKIESILLVGGDTGAYGLDIKHTLYDLLVDLLNYEGNHKIYLHDFNINWFIADADRLINLFDISKNKNLRGITFPIQSGSDKILRRMKRPYSAKKVIEALNSLKKKSPNLLIGTHIIVGFPGETENDFNESIKLLSETKFDFVSCFAYSDIKGTSAYLFDDKISNNIIKERLIRIKEIYKENVTIYL